DEHRIDHTRLFLGPFGRRELKQLIARIVGADDRDMVDRVLRVVMDQRLPRNPFIFAAMISVLALGKDPEMRNPSAILDAYANLLLGRWDFGDRQGSELDYRRLEHLLAFLAGHLTRTGQARLLRNEVERLVLEYFDARGLRNASAGQRID